MQPVQQIVASLSAVHDHTWNLHISLYKLHLACLRDEHLWGEGLRATEQALKRLPKEYHRRLWEERVIFKCNITKRVEASSSALKDNDKELLAKVYSFLRWLRLQIRPHKNFSCRQFWQQFWPIFFFAPREISGDAQKLSEKAIKNGLTPLLVGSEWLNFELRIVKTTSPICLKSI